MFVKEIVLNFCRLIRGEVPLKTLQKNGLKVGKELYRAGGG